MKASIEKQVFETQKLITEELSKRNLDKAWTLLEKSEKLLKNIENSEKKQNCLRVLYSLYGKYYIATEEYTKATTYLEETLKIPGFSAPETLEILINLCNLLNHSHSFQKLLMRSEQALSIILTMPSDPSAALVYYYIGLAQQNLQNFALAEKNFKESLALANQSLGYNHPTTSLVTQKYLKFLKIVQNTKLPLKAVKNNRNRRVSTSNESNLPTRMSTSNSKQSKKGFLPNIRNSFQSGEIDLIPIFPHNNVRTPRTGSISSEKYQEIMTPIKGRTPQTSCRLRVRRLSAELVKGFENNEENKVNVEENKVKAEENKRKKEEIKVKSEESKAKSEEINGKKEEIKGKKEEIKGKKEEIKGKKEEIKGKKEENKGKNEEINRSTRDGLTTSRQSLDSRIKTEVFRARTQSQPPKPEKLNLNHIILIQKHIRGWIQRRKFSKVKRQALKGRTEKVVAELNDLKAQMLILKTVEHDSKVIYKLEYTKKDVIEKVLKYILIIQKHYRGYIARKNWKKLKKSALKIQSCIKMYLVKVLFQKILMAIKFIQSSWRHYKVGKIKLY